MDRDHPEQQNKTARKFLMGTLPLMPKSPREAFELIRPCPDAEWATYGAAWERNWDECVELYRIVTRVEEMLNSAYDERTKSGNQLTRAALQAEENQIGRERCDEEFLTDIRLRQAIAMISSEPLAGEDATIRAATAAALLTTAIVNKAISAIEDDDDRFVAGIFAFIFSDYFAAPLASDFEEAASIAVMKVVGTEEFEGCFDGIKRAYGQIIQWDPKIVEAISKNCEAWFKNPSPSQFERLTALFKILRRHLVMT
jgi:hypothetical protein